MGQIDHFHFIFLLFSSWRSAGPEAVFQLPYVRLATDWNGSSSVWEAGEEENTPSMASRTFSTPMSRIRFSPRSFSRLALGSTQAVKPIFTASATRCPAWETARTSPERPTSPKISMPGSTSRFLKLDSEHIRFVMDGMQKNTTEVRNMKQYLLAVLFNAPTTISNHYTVQVNHDMNTGGW